DKSGAAVSGAQIDAINQGTNAVTTGKTDGDGNYNVTNLAPGTYTVNIKAPGFKIYSGNNIVLFAQHVVRVDASLEVGSATTQVVVNGGAAVINTDTSTITATITNEDLNDTATNLRSTADATGDSGIFNFIELVPTGYQSSGARFSMGGARGSEDNFNIDGISGNSPAYGNYIGDLQPSFEMISEVNYEVVDAKAEYGPPVNVTTVTQSGTNALHGSIFEFNQNSDFDALNYFATRRTSNVYNDFGGSVGGPIKKNKLFFFLVYEGDRQHIPAIVNASVPTLKMRTGDLSELIGTQIVNPYTGQPFQNNLIPPTLLNQTALKWQELFDPLPNSGPVGSYTANFRNQYTQSISHNEGDARIDWLPTNNNRLYGRYFYKRSNPEVLDSQLPPSIAGYRVQQRVSQQFVLSDSWIITPQTVNVATVGFSRDRNAFGGSLIGQQIINAIGLQGLPATPPNVPNAPSVSVNGFTEPTPLGENLPTQNSFQYIDQITFERGNHTIKAGGEFKPQQYNAPIYPTFGSYGFSNQFSNFSYSDFLLGLPASTSYTYVRPSQYSRLWFLNGFVQDDWKITPRLTLNYGVRYDYYSPGRDVNNAIANFDPTTGNLVIPTRNVYTKYVNPAFPSNVTVETAQQAGFPERTLRNAFKLGFQPRIGFAWQPFGSSKTVVSGGYGFFRDELTADIMGYLYGAPFGLTKSYTNIIASGQPVLTFTTPFSGSYSVGTVTASSLDKNLTSPYAQQWNLTVERDLGFQTALRLSYIGMKISQLIYGRNINQVHASVLPYNPLTVPYLNYQGVNYEANGAHQSYNALTAEVIRRMHNGLMFDAAYTWSKNLTDDDEIGDVEGGVTIEDTYNLQRERGNAEFDPRQRFVSSVIWALPVGNGKAFLNRHGILNVVLGGWQLSGNFTAQTGQFYTPQFSGADPSNTNTFGGRPDVIGNPNLPSSKRSIAHWFNVAAFAVPKNGQFGTARNGSVVGPGQDALNAGLFKTFKVYDQMSLRLQGSFTNVLNHPNFGQPDMNISTGTSAGVITSTSQNSFSGARTGQVGARLYF
ncbi:MAG TPA: TonB-dependent receptor, partial [Anaerolineales bacterium]|nr:TonB-dependent receptor [Anaerolineales bacterium]